MTTVDQHELSLVKHLLNAKFGHPSRYAGFCPAWMFPSIDPDCDDEFIVIDESGQRHIKINDAYQFMINAKNRETE